MSEQDCINIEPASLSVLEQVYRLLGDNGLPVAGVETHIETLRVAQREGVVVGSAGLELYGEFSLLRSVAVAKEQRKQGLGKRLVEKVLQIAKERGVRKVFLLTMTAEKYFAREFGFRVIAREMVETAVKQSVEFTSACPCSAKVMVLEIGEKSLNKGNDPMNDRISDAVKSKYGAVAQSGLTNEHKGVRAVAEAFGYTPEELESIPAEANMGLSCGNPTATAHLKEGEVVVDLGSGGGLDVFLAAQKVGPTGKAIGIDMTPAMIDRANAAAQRDGFGNVEFKLGTVDRIPLPDGVADVVISNCVINLAPDKAAVFREIARILKPGGRVAVSDITIKKDLPGELAQDIMAFVGCIAGAIKVEEYEAGLKAAGLTEVMVVDSGKDLNAYAKVENQSCCCAPPMAEAVKKSCCCGESAEQETTCCSSGTEGKAELHDHLAELLKRYDVNEYAASVKVFAIKPRK